MRYVIRRLAISVPVVLGILLISYVLVQMMPGDPVRAMMSPEEIAASPELVEFRREQLGLNQPVLVQFFVWLRELSQGNLGFSIRRGVPVGDMIAERVGPTVLLASVGLLLALVVGVTIGILSALKQNTWIDYSASVGSVAAISIPSFFLGLLAIYVFSISLGLLPSAGTRTLGAEPSLANSIKHLTLPACVLAASLVGSFVRFTRQGMLEVLRQDHITTAKAKGVPYRRIIVKHGLRNALIPLTTMLAVLIPGLLGGVLIVETIFSWPGLGRLFFESIGARDYPVVISMVLISAILVVACNLLADLLAAVLDPRIRL